MAAVSASYVSSLYNAGALASGVGKRASTLMGAPLPKASTEIEDRLSQALEAMKRAPEEQKQATRNRARERVEAVREQLKIIKELYAQNPKEMAKALRHLVKELKSALKAYKDAGGDMSALSGAGLPAMAAVSTTAPAAEASSGEGLSGDPDMDDQELPATAELESETADVEPDAEMAAHAEKSSTIPQAPAGEASRSGQASASVDELDARLGELMGDEEFVRSVDGLKRKIKELFETAKIQSAFLAQDKARDSAFEALDEDLKALDEDVTEYKRDVQDELITVRLEIKMIERGDLSAPVSLDVTA